jgi:hypothetical protein
LAHAIGFESFSALSLEFEGVGVLLLGEGEFLGEGLDFVLEFVVDEVQFLFLVADEAFLDFHLLNDFEVLVFEDEDAVLEGHVFMDNIAVFFPDK